MLNDPAIYPPVPSITIHLPGLPDWTFTAAPARSNAMAPFPLAASDVLRALAAELHRLVPQATWNAHAEPLRTNAVRAFHRRVRGDARAHSAGLKRIDFLLGRTLFAGLREKRSRPGEWEVVLLERT